MEERTSSSSTINDPTSLVYANHVSVQDDSDEYETFVVQVPKDQIYRVPPPENAKIAEKRRKAVPERKSCISMYCMLVFLVIVVFLTVFITGVSLAAADKDDPAFRVRRIEVNTKGKGRMRRHVFDVTLGARNPNDRAVISFEKGGKAMVSFRNRQVAKGRFPAFEQGTESSRNVKLSLLSGNVTRLPKEIQKSVKGTTGRPIRLSLGFKVPLNFKVGVFGVKSKTISILCHVRVSKLTKNARVLSQDCDYSTS